MSPLARSGAFLVALVVLGPFLAAQAGARPPGAVSAAPRHATLDLATGEIRRGSQDKSVGLVTIWANTDYSGYYSTWWAVGAEWLDWGAITTTSGSDVIGSLTFGYATTALDTTAGGLGARLCTNFYDDAVGWCMESGLGLIPDGSFCFSGLPGTTISGVPQAWFLTVDLVGGSEFTQDAGPFGYGLRLFDTVTGPLLCYAGSSTGGVDSNGQEDAFDVYVTDVTSGTCGTYWFGGYGYNFCSWWLRIDAADASGGPAAGCGFYCGSGGNADGFTVTSVPVLGGTFVGSVVASGPNVGAGLVAYATPFSFSTPWGELLVNVLDPRGELLGFPGAFGDPAVIRAPVPPNLHLAGTPFHVQALGIGGGMRFHCAYACTVGF